MKIAADSPEEKHPGKILVVDDVPETGKFFADQLQKHFAVVETATPKSAEWKIKRGNYNALVTDLRFVENGQLDNGLQLVQRLNGHCPPTVILTASISGQTLALIISQAVHIDGTPLLRGAMKGGGVNMLVAQIRGGIADAERISPEIRAAGIKNISVPEFNTGEAPVKLMNIVALLGEKLKNYVRITQENLAILKERYGLADWPSWKTICATVEGQLGEFATYSSKKFIGTSEKDTLNALHELNSRIILLDLDRLVPPTEYKEESIYIMRSMRNEHAQISREIKSSFQNGEEVCNPMFDFENSIKEIFRHGNANLRIRDEDKHETSRTRLRDNGRLITTLFEEIQKQFNEQGCLINVVGFNEKSFWWDGSETQQKMRKKINWGGGYKISIHFNHYGNEESKFFGKKNYDQILDPLRGIIEKLTKEKKIYIDPAIFSYETDEYGGSFDIFLKTAEIDHEKLAREATWEETIKTTKIGKMYIGLRGQFGEEVLEVETPTGKMTLIGCSFPKRMKHMGGNFCAVMDDGELIVASSSAHFECNIALCHYLVSRKKMDLNEAYTRTKNSTRMKLKGNRLEVCHEKMDKPQLAELEELFENMGMPNYYHEREQIVEAISPIMNDLEIQGVICDSNLFLGRSEMYFVTVEYLEEEETSDGDITLGEYDNEEFSGLHNFPGRKKDVWEDEEK